MNTIPGGLEYFVGRRPLLVVGGLGRNGREDFRAASAASFDKKIMLVLRADFGDTEVESFRRHRSGLHRRAKTGSSRFEAVYRHDEIVLSTGGIVGVAEATVEEYVVVNQERLEFAGAYPDESIVRRLFLGVYERGFTTLPAQVQYLYTRRESELLPRIRADHVTEQRLVLALHKAIASRILVIAPSDRELLHLLKMRISDPALGDCRTNRGIAPSVQFIEKDL